jgi:hypothetical protein
MIDNWPMKALLWNSPLSISTIIVALSVQHHSHRRSKAKSLFTSASPPITHNLLTISP